MKKKTTRVARPKGRPDPSRYPKGWNRERVQALIDHYENQSDEEAIAEADAAWKNTKTAMIQVPLKLVPRIRKLLRACMSDSMSRKHAASRPNRTASLRPYGKFGDGCADLKLQCTG